MKITLIVIAVIAVVIPISVWLYNAVIKEVYDDWKRKK